MSGLTSFGILHTAISMVAVFAGLFALIRDQEISQRNAIGKTYLSTTALSCLSGLGIFHHGGFGPPHVLSLVTLAVLALGMAAASTEFFGGASRAVTTVSFSATFFFHMIPLFTESFTRLPVDAPLVAGLDSPVLQTVLGACFVLFLIGATLQVRSLRAERRARAGGDVLTSIAR